MEGIDDLEDGSISTIVCSPPYWGLRDYGDSKSIWDDDPTCHHVWSTINNKCFDCNAWLGQLGLEPSYKLYVKHLVAVFEKLKTKLRDDGSLWVNLGDTYAGGNGINIPKGMTREDIKKKWDVGNSVEWTATKIQAFPLQNPQAKLKKMTKSQIGIPERFKIAMIDSGWICRNTVIWHKPNPMPSSVRDRYTNDFEYFYFFTKKKKYYFKQQLEDVTKNEETDKKRNKRTLWTEDDKYLDSKYDNPEHEASIRQGMNKERGKGVVRKRKLPPQDKFVSMIREWILHDNDKTTLTEAIEELATLTEIPISTVQHWFRKDEEGFAYPSIEDWEKVQIVYKKKSIGYDFSYLVDYYEESDEIRNMGEGKRNKRTTWRVNVANLKKAHFAVFPRELIRSPIDACVPEKICLECDKPMDTTPCSCDAGFRKGVILDPFCGSGTTIIEAIEQNKMGIGIEINPDYVEIANNRIAEETTLIIENDLDWLDWVIEEEGGE